jgi:hypothetical protein
MRDPGLAHAWNGHLARPEQQRQDLGVAIFANCRATYEELDERGVEFVQQPEEWPYGIDSALRDP